MRDSNDSIYNMRCAWDFFEKRDYANAEKYCIIALEKEDLAGAYAVLSYIQLRERNIIKSDFYYKKAIEINAGDPAVCVIKAYRLFLENKHEEAIEEYTKALEITDSKCAYAYLGRGTVYCDQKKYENAIKDFNSAKKINNNLAHAYNGLGNAYRGLKKCKDALAAYGTAIEIDKNFANPHNGQGMIHFDKEKYEEALKDYEAAIAIDCKFAQAYNGLGNILLRQEKYLEAKVEFEKAINADPNLSHAHSGLGKVYFNLKSYKKALNEYKMAEKLSPNDPLIYSNRGDVYRDQGSYDAALEEYNKAIKNGLKNPAIAYTERGKVYQYMERNNDALKEYDKAIQINPNHKFAYYNRGLLNENLENYADAIKDYKKYKSMLKNEPGMERSMTTRIHRMEKMLSLLNPKGTGENKDVEALMSKILNKQINSKIKKIERGMNRFLEEKIEGEDTVCDHMPEFLLLRRWNSYTPILSNRKDMGRGGGYFFKISDCGVVIDPGFNFIDNMISQGLHFHDIEHVLITHSHNDHTADLESILTLLYKYNDLIKGDMYDPYKEVAQTFGRNNNSRKSIMAEVFDELGVELGRTPDPKEDGKLIEQRVEEKFADSPRRKRICIYLTASTFKKYAAMLELYQKQDYDVVIIKANDVLEILNPNKKSETLSEKYPLDRIKISVIRAKHKDTTSDKDSVGFIFEDKNTKFVLIYTGDTGFDANIQKIYEELKGKYNKSKIVLLAHLGGFKSNEDSFEYEKSIEENKDYFYKYHLGRIGLCKMIETLKPELCLVSEFGEEFRETRCDLIDSFNDVYGSSTKFLAADIGLRIRIDAKIQAITKIEDNNMEKTYIGYRDVGTTQRESDYSLHYYKNSLPKGQVDSCLLKEK